LAFPRMSGKEFRGDAGICCSRHVVPQPSGHNWSSSSINSVVPQSRWSLTAVQARGKASDRRTDIVLPAGVRGRTPLTYIEGFFLKNLSNYFSDLALFFWGLQARIRWEFFRRMRAISLRSRPV
jgi:hypothetical protein